MFIGFDCGNISPVEAQSLLGGDLANIRNATEADLPAILSIHNHYVLRSIATPLRDQRTMGDQRRWYSELVQGRFPVLVAEQDGLVAGYCYVDRLAPGPSFAPALEEHIYLDPHQLARGFGTQLLNAIVERSRDLGIRTLIARIDASNTASIRVHKKCGFATVGTVRDVAYKNGTFLSFTIMQLLFDGYFKFD